MLFGDKGLWQHGSVFKTTVFGWWTFPDVCLIFG